MAIINQITIGNILYLVVDADPTTAGGIAAPIGSVSTDSVTGLLYTKVGSSNTQWSVSAVGAGFTSGNSIAFNISANESKNHFTVNTATFFAMSSVVLDKSAYNASGATRSFKTTFLVKVSAASTAIEMRLFNVTTNSAVTGSLITVTPGTINTYFTYTATISDANIAAGSNVYEFQIRKTGGSGDVDLYWTSLQAIFSY